MARRTIIDTKTNFISEFATEDDKFVYHTQQNVAPVLDHVKKIKELNPVPGKEMRHCAEIPMVIYEKMVREGWAQDKAKMKRWLNDPENKMFRTWQGKV
jgi:hypothetical protein|tara:strand:- start:2158 stop:2454 length:297 start_codon:yes stop_codon:yes gene_type:complete